MMKFSPTPGIAARSQGLTLVLKQTKGMHILDQNSVGHLSGGEK